MNNLMCTTFARAPWRMLTILSSLFFAVHSGATAAVIRDISSDGNQTGLYETIEYQLTIEALEGDPFDQRQTALDLIATAPSGKSLRVPGFYQHDSEPKGWRVRFTPQEQGTYRLQFELLKNGAQEDGKKAPDLMVIASGKDGFLKPNDLWTWKYDSGRPFRAIGENVCWEGEWRGKHYSYDQLLSELSLNGANFYRTWMCYWNLPVEWKKVQAGGINQESTSTYNESAVKRFDQLIQLNERLQLHMMLAIDWHGAIMTHDKWPMYSYNVVNGGPCETPRDFFTHPEAKALYKNRLRYLVARFGCSPSIAAWEFFNEVDNTAFPENIPHEAVTSWHREMSDYLKSVDPYGRIVTTSVSHRDIEGMNDLPSIDLNQRHIYIHTADIPKTLRSYAQAHGKAYAIGEGGYDWDWNKIFDWRGEEFDDHFKRGLWYGLFSPTPVLPMSWWWEFFHERGMIPYFRIVRAVHERMILDGGGSYAEESIVSEGIEAYAVRCGQSVFVYVRNGNAESVEAKIRIPGMNSGSYHVESIDPETSILSVRSGLNAQPDGLDIDKIQLKRSQQLILITHKAD
jgi:hypothetical protein